MELLTRASLGFRLPAAIQASLTEAQTVLKRRGGADGARWTPPHELLLSLCPLGELTIPQMVRVQETLPDLAAAHAPFDLGLEGIGGSPNATQPRFAWAGVTGDLGALQALHASVEAALASLRLPRESRPLSAHIVLGRLKIESERARSDLGRAVRLCGVGAMGSWRVEELELLKGDVGPTGPTTVLIRGYGLGGC